MPSMPPAEPAVLLVGAGAAMESALTQALDRHGVFVETAAAGTVVDAVVAAAPDLILLVGDAARDCGAEVLAELSGSPLSSVVPVAILDDNAALDARLQAFRHGAAAIIPNSASADGIADQVARLAREIPERDGGSLGNLGESTLEDLVTALGKELKSGVLSVRGENESEADAVRLVLGGGQPLTEVIDEFVARLRGHIVLAEPLRYEFDERAAGTVQLLGGDEERPSQRGNVNGLRILLADDDAARADAVAQQLRSHGTTVVVTDLEPTPIRFERLRQVDPTVLLIGEKQLQGLGYELIRRMRRDTRLRWASLLVVRWDEVWGDDANVSAVDRLLGTLAELVEPERAVSARADSGEPFDTRLEAMGPTRLLRALANSAHPVRLTVFNPRVQVSIEISNELVVSASAHLLGPDLQQLDGAAALSAFVVLGSGRAHTEAVEQPSSTNVMSPIDVALNMADAEPAPIPPSLPSPASDSVRPQIAGAAARAAAPAPRAPEIPVPPGEPASPPPPPSSLSAEPALPVPAAPAGSTAPPLEGPVSEPPISVDADELIPMQSEAPPVPATAAGAEPDETDVIPLRVGVFGRLRRWLDDATHPLASRRKLVGWLVVIAAVQIAAILVVLAALSPSTGAHRSKGPATGKSAAPPPTSSSKMAAAVSTSSAAASAKTAPSAAPSATTAHSAAPAKTAHSAASASGRATLAPPNSAPTASGGKPAKHPPLPVIHHGRAPTCRQLLTKEPASKTGLPGAAYRAIVQARRGLVRGDLDAAERSYCRATILDRHSVAAAVELARVFLLRRDGHAAAVWAHRAAKRGADDATVKGLLGDAYALSGLFDKARRAWLEANGGQPGDKHDQAALARKSLAIAKAAARVRAHSRAERYFRRAVVLAPDSTSAAIGLTRALLDLDVRRDALVWARYAIAEAPRSAAAWVALGDVLHRKGNHVQARRAWKKALELQPGNPAAESRLRL